MNMTQLEIYYVRIGVMKMLTKEECKEAVSILKNQHEYLSFTLRANYPFSIEMIRKVQDCFEQLIKEYFNPQPYKFDELKKGMWVWDDKSKCCFKCNPAISTDMAQCVTYNAFWYNCGEDEDEFFEEYDEFEEGRFFPVTKALEYQE